MLGNIFPPFTTMQECNLDWILTKVKNILRFVPDDGQVGQILRRTRSGAEWSDEQGGGGAVNSVNGQTGTVVLTAADVGALPDSTPIPTNTSDLNNDSGFITSAQAPVQSVNGQTGSVSLSIPTKTSDLNNDSGFITAGQAPVQSVNGQTGTVTLSIPTNTSDLNNDSGFVDAAGAAAAAPVQSVNGLTGAVTTVKHLWHNSNPTANFDPQTISLAANTCSLFLIICRISAIDSFNTLPTFIIPGNPGWIEFPAGSGGVQSGALVLWSKEVTASSQTSLSFGNSVVIGALQGTNNGIIIPIDVYGF